MSRGLSVCVAVVVAVGAGGPACTSYGATELPSQSDGGGSTVHDAKKCDPEKVADCIAPPPGWMLVAVAEGNEAAVCPEGFDRPSDYGEDPVPRADACDCSTCKVTEDAKCEGKIAGRYGDSNACPDDESAPYSNTPGGTCLTDRFDGIFAPFERYAPPPAVGGACVNEPVRADRVDFSKKVRVCENAARCSGGTCDGFVATPYRACVANAVEGGDASCPASFPTKRTAGTTATFDCGGGCACTVDRAPCTGSITHYKNADCTGTAVATMLDNTCRNVGLGNTTWAAYKVTATTSTTCTGTGTATASNVRLVKPRTICCR